jgi:hypothetical protein
VGGVIHSSWVAPLWEFSYEATASKPGLNRKASESPKEGTSAIVKKPAQPFRHPIMKGRAILNFGLS